MNEINGDTITFIWFIGIVVLGFVSTFFFGFHDIEPEPVLMAVLIFLWPLILVICLCSLPISAVYRLGRFVSKRISK